MSETKPSSDGLQWRGLEERTTSSRATSAPSPEFADADAMNAITRRNFLRTAAIPAVAAGLTACNRQPDSVPYIRQPENMIPGVPRFFASAVVFEGYAQPVVAEVHEGRPTKLEGNLDHACSHGATDAFTQAAILELYNAQRSTGPTYLGRPTSWPTVDAQLLTTFAALKEKRGAGFRLLTGPVTSPTLRRQIDALLSAFPEARWHVMDAVSDGLRAESLREAFGRPLTLHLHPEHADYVLSFDDDVLGPGPAQVIQMHRWAERRRAVRANQGEALLHVAECSPSLTGVMATTRFPVAPSRLGVLLNALAAKFGVVAAGTETLSTAEQTWVDTRARELEARRGRSLVTVGIYQPVDVQMLGFALNHHLGNGGKTVTYTASILPDVSDAHGLAALIRDMAGGHVDTLFILDVNPVYNAPDRTMFNAALERVPLRLHAALYYDETAAQSHWHMPIAHALEDWSDARAVDGTATIIQPLVHHFLSVRPTHEIMQRLVAEEQKDAYDIVRETWAAHYPTNDFENQWRHALNAGFVPDTASTIVAATPMAAKPVTPAPVHDVEILIRPDPTIWDGRFTPLDWLQELPKPLTKITWDNVVLISVGFAADLGVANGDHLEIRTNDGLVVGPAWLMPGQPNRTVTVFMGYGRTRTALNMAGIGYDANFLRATARHWTVHGTMRRADGRTALATTQVHSAMDGFDFVKTVQRLQVGTPIPEASRASLYTARAYGDTSWGMVIDLDLCVGCNACVTACQAENNIPAVGKDQVAMGREMHWLRIDRYFEGPPESPQIHFQPVPCMHCEQAPCEMGCPVHATVHSTEGINQMVYNRCIGTRTCSSYCPYKVRRFNWYDYTGDAPPGVQAQRNPDVTVRARGVMEKCTYCIQRINGAEITAQKANRTLQDGEVKTACQAACPAQAIVFGNVGDSASAVSEAKRDPRNYNLLDKLDTRPRTTYLAKISDATPEGADTL